jgi:prepilin-type processing-associated H-X9-DG protein
MLIPAIVAVIILMLPVGYVIMRKLTITRQEIVFTTPQDGVKAVYVDLQEDKVRRLYVLFADGSVSEVVTSPTVAGVIPVRQS